MTAWKTFIRFFFFFFLFFFFVQLGARYHLLLIDIGQGKRRETIFVERDIEHRNKAATGSNTSSNSILTSDVSMLCLVSFSANPDATARLADWTVMLFPGNAILLNFVAAGISVAEFPILEFCLDPQTNR